MNRPRFHTFALSTILTLATASETFAAPQTYLGMDNPKGSLTNTTKARNDFLATLSSYGVDTLESFTHGDLDPTLSFGSTGITATTDVDMVAEFALFAVTDGSKLLLDDAGPNASAPPIDDVFTFSQPITAFGTYIVNAGSDAQANAITLILENTILGTSKEVAFSPLGPRLGFNATGFLGVTDTDPFNKITWRESFDYDGILMDDITVGFVKAVPEPSTWALLGTALLALGAMRRRMPTKKTR